MLEEVGYIKVENLITDELRNYIKTSVDLLADLADYHGHNFSRFADKGKPHMGIKSDTKWWMGNVTADAMLVYLQPMIEEKVGRKLLPTYGYLRQYQKGDAMLAHRDRPNCEYSVTMTIEDNGDHWDIAMEDISSKQHNFVTLKNGDACIYKGAESEHFREEKTTDGHHIQMFLHYVAADGLFSVLHKERRPLLGMEVILNELS